MNTIPKFQFQCPIIQMAADSLGTCMHLLSKGGIGAPDVTTTRSEDGMKLIPGCFCYQSCLTFLGDLVRPLHW